MLEVAVALCRCGRARVAGHGRRARRHCSTKRHLEWPGYKVQVTETCDEDAAHLVTHVMTCPAMQPDMARRRTQAERACEQRHFSIDWEREQATCPQGKTAATWRAGLDEIGAPRTQAVFSRTGCGACAARALCTPAEDARRSAYFHPRPDYEALNAARARMHGPAWEE